MHAHVYVRNVRLLEHTLCAASRARAAITLIGTYALPVLITNALNLKVSVQPLALVLCFIVHEFLGVNTVRELNFIFIVLHIPILRLIERFRLKLSQVSYKFTLVIIVLQKWHYILNILNL